jgi:DNA-binding XRE family transcriptional regulator
VTPAEKLSAAKPWRKKPSGASHYDRKCPWKCQCRAIREGLRLSLRDVADKVGLSPTGLHQIEQGTDPLLTTAVRLAAFFGKEISELWTKLA